MLKRVVDAVGVLCIGGGLMVAGGAADAPALGLAESLVWIAAGAAATGLGFLTLVIRDCLWRY